MIRSITLLGSSSGRNAGDAALMSAIMECCDSACREKLLYEIPTIKPGFVKTEYPFNVRPVSILPWNFSLRLLGFPTYASVMRTDLSLVFDAVLFDRSLYNPMFNFLSSLYVVLKAARKRGKKMGCFNVSLGPVTTPMGRKMLRELLEGMDFVTVRDQGSLDLYRELGVQNPNVALTADSALNAPAASVERSREILKSVGMPENQEILAINVNSYLGSWSGSSRAKLTKEEFLETYARAINLLQQKYPLPLLFVATQHSDIALTKELMGMVRTRQPMAMVDNKRFTHPEVKGVLSQVALLFAMRLHASILASGSCTPVAALAFLPKVTFYYRDLGLSQHCHSFENFGADYIFSAIARAWEDRRGIRMQLERVIPELQRRADLAGQVVAAMHRGEDVGAVVRGLGASDTLDGAAPSAPRAA